ncbi:IclR family transcriptional regulator [Paraburkholderia sp.]|uniref:IclR family transcriptional regulator n=1 Tax=Paraburkholderia sp. TaxID=1926495 RepID=UPI0039E3FFE7
MRVVEFLSKIQSPVGVRDLSRHLDMPVASIHRVLQALKRERLIVQVSDQGLYASGERLVELATNLMRAHNLVPVASPFLNRMAALSGESATLMVMEGNEAVCVASVESEQMLRVVFPVGWRGPLYRGASGRLLLAFQPVEVIETVIENGAREEGADRLLDSEALRRSLPELRKAGYVVSHGERHEGWSSVAAAIHAPGATVIGSVALYGPNSRFGDKQLEDHAKHVTECARSISDALAQLVDAGPIGPQLDAESLRRRQYYARPSDAASMPYTLSPAERTP